MTYAARSALFGWRRAVVYVLLLGLVTHTLEAVVPNSAVAGANILLRGLSGAPGWVVAAAVIVGVTLWSVPRLSLPAVALITVVVVGVVTLLRSALPDPLVTIRALDPLPVVNVNPFYLAWGQLLYSLLFVGAIALAWRAEHTKELLAQAEIARSRSEALFDHAEFASLQGVVDPAFVLRVLEQMQRLYATDAAAADRLLDRLVAFLRLAMPAVRSGRSTLGAELALARSYTNLCQALGLRGGGWSWNMDASLDDAAFPPLLLLPLLDALVTGVASDAQLRLETHRDGSHAVLTFHGPAMPGWLPDALLHRLRVGLRAFHSDTAGITLAAADAADEPAIRIRFPCVTLTPLVRSQEPQQSQPAPGGTATWTTLPATTPN